eukprot:TRINITY_DN20448_c0_g1_i1.p1 TRINITY_DN20448_c0_g1~~TRINITY_DN20448_c0_g1_i1.p1  ORF type:complete len:903 (+),score=111.40 TRINITY_DN20448_c0_g1_i1:46-2754(+)
MQDLRCLGRDGTATDPAKPMVSTTNVSSLLTSRLSRLGSKQFQPSTTSDLETSLLRTIPSDEDFDISFLRPRAQSLVNSTEMNLTAEEKRCATTRPQRQGLEKLVQNIAVALIACFLGATDGVSLGSLIFPSSAEFPNAEFKALGMSIGLLTSFIVNLGSVLGSQMEFSVGGANIPTIMVLASYFSRTMGPTRCPTILVMIAVATVAGGAIIWLVGYFRLARAVKACPFVVYGGFMAGTGIVLLQCGLNMMHSGFVSLFDTQSYKVIMQTIALPMWLPGTLAGITLFFIQAKEVKIPFIASGLLIPFALAVLVVVFYCVMWATGSTVEDARSLGYMFDVDIPSHPIFYTIWTTQVASLPHVEWTALFTPSFAIAVVNSALISTLTIVMNIFGTARTTGRSIDLDREIMLHGLYNMGGGLGSSLPGNTVMSFSVTCKLLGAEGRQFQMLLLIFSFLLFIFGNYVVALLPKMLPGTVLIWLGLELMSFWIWTSRSFLLFYEYILIWIMIILYACLGSGPMMIFGIIAATSIAMWQFSKVPVMTSKPFSELRSVHLRSSCDRKYLISCGSKAQVWVINTPYLFFASVREIVDTLEEKTLLRKLQYVVLDFGNTKRLEISAVSALREALECAIERKCRLVLARPNQDITDIMRLFNLPITELHSKKHNVVTAGPDDGKHLLLAPSLTAALQWVEEALLSACTPKNGECRAGPMHLHDEHEAMLKVIPHADALWGLWEDMHVNVASRESLETLVTELKKVIQVCNVRSGTFIYEQPPPRIRAKQTPLSPSSAADVPPLVWLLLGCVEHIWNPQNDTDDSIKAFGRECGLQPDDTWEIGTVTEGRTCAGPFKTARAFFACMSHPGSLQAVCHSKVAVLKRSDYEKLDPNMRTAIQMYLFGHCSNAYFF